jgi:hypothetical protein
VANSIIYLYRITAAPFFINSIRESETIEKLNGTSFPDFFIVLRGDEGTDV